MPLSLEGSDVLRTKLAGLRPVRLAGDRLSSMLVRRSRTSTPDADTTSGATTTQPGPELSGQKPVVGELVIVWTEGARGKGAGGDLGAEFARELSASPGRPLPDEVRARLEPAFDRDFSDVVVHTDSLAARLARRIHALAFAVGRHVYFGRGRFDPESPEGLALIGHELTHVAQTRGGRARVHPRFGTDHELESPRRVARAERTPGGVFPLARKLERDALVHHLRRRTYEVSGEDSHERQALANERTLLRALTRTPRPDELPRLRASPFGSDDVIRGDSGTSGEKSGFRVAMESNRDWWEQVAERGFQKGGVLGYAQAIAGTVASTINDPWYIGRQSEAYTVGFVEGAWAGAKGMWNIVRHPIQTAEGVYTLVVHWDQTSKLLSQKINQMLDHATSDPELFAKECGEIAGQIDIALVGPKAIGGIKEVTGALKTMRNLAGLPGRTLWYYTDTAGAAAVKASSTIGKSGASFATALDPALGGSRTLAGVFAENFFLGGRLDCVVAAGKIALKIKPAFTVATEFVGGAFRPILMTTVENAVFRFMKTLGGFQFAASTPQQVTIVAQQILGNVETATTFFKSAGMIAEGSGYLVLGNAKISMDQIAKTDWSSVQPDPRLRDRLGEHPQAHEPHRKRRGFSKFDDDDPELAEIHSDVLARYGHEPGVSLEISTKYRLEKWLGREIGEVRIHSGPVAARLARETEAVAVTTGRDVYMPSGTLDTRTPEGLGLLAHEVTHVVQQGPATPRSSPRALGGGSTGEVLESVAHAIERRIVASARASAYPVVEGVVRAAPIAPPVMVSAAPSPAPGIAQAPEVAAAPAPVASPGPGVLRDVEGGDFDLESTSGDGRDPSELEDPVAVVMNDYSVSAAVSQEEFMEIVTDRILMLMRDELILEAERKGSVSLDDSLPAP